MRLKLRDEASRLLLAAVLFGAGAAAAQDYPASTETPVLSAWLGDSTNIAPSTVVTVTRELVVAIVGKTAPATPGGPVRLTLREEVIAPGYVDTVGGRSSLMSMEIHCEERRIRMDERRLYSGLNLTGAVEMTDPSAEWVRIPEGSIMDDVARAACEAEFPWPLARPATPNIAVAALSAPPPALPPGPDAKLAPDEPEPAEEKIVVVETAPAPEPTVPVVETAVEPPPPQEEPLAAEMVVATETAIPPEMEIPASAPEPPAEPPAPAIEPSPEPQPLLSQDIEAAPPPREEPVAVEISPEAEIPPPPEQFTAMEPAETSPSIEPEPAVPAEAEIAPPPVEMALQAIPEREPDPDPEVTAPLPAGPVFAAQIGAYETREMAEDAWADFSAKRPVLVEGLTFEIQPARVKGKNWHRGLVGRFATRREAVAFCTAIAGGEYGCILRTLTD